MLSDALRNKFYWHVIKGIRVKRNVFGAAVLLACSALSAPALAQDFKDRLTALLGNHNLIETARLDVGAAEERVREAWGQYFPNVNVSGSIGREGQVNGTSDNTLLNPREFNLTIRQKVYDFGATDASIRRTKLEKRAADVFQEIALQDLLLEALVAQLNLVRAEEVVDFARRSEANIQTQVDAEQERVAAGSGQQTDLLQVQTQLAGAQARRVEVEGQLQLARNLYKRIFGDFPLPSASKEVPLVPKSALPTSVEEAVDLTESNNLRVQAARLGADVLKETLEETRSASYRPSLDAVAELSASNQADGIDAFERETIAKLELSFPFNLGWTARNTVRAADLTQQAGFRRANQVFVEIEELVRNAWQNYQTAKANAVLRKSQAQLAEEFLELAREERRLGRRSLIDVLAGETEMLNAQADAAAAERDVDINAFTVLSLVSTLSINDVDVVPYEGAASIGN